MRSGRPLAGVQVAFLPDVGRGAQGPRASGFTDASGRYELWTDAGERGVTVGWYRVCIMRPPKLDMRRDPGGALGERLKEWRDAAAKSDAAQVPRQYRHFEKTPLRAEVKPGGDQTFDFELSNDQSRPSH